MEENTEKNCNVNGSSSLFSGTLVEENTMNLSKRNEDKELFSGTIVEENTDKVIFVENINNMYNKIIELLK